MKAVREAARTAIRRGLTTESGKCGKPQWGVSNQGVPPLGESDWLHLSPDTPGGFMPRPAPTPLEQAYRRTRNVQTFEETRKQTPDLFEVVCVVMGIACALAITVALLATAAWIVLMVIGVI